MIAVTKSSMTIMFLLFVLSAIIPPTSDKITIGKKEQAVAIPNKADEPVSFNK